MSEIEKAGRIRVSIDGRRYKADWQVVGDKVQINSEIGAACVTLGALRSAPAAVALEKFREMTRQANRPVKPRTDRARFDVRDG
jgi:hypothetical protein